MTPLALIYRTSRQICLLLILAWVGPVEARDDYIQLRCAMHIHSLFSTGEESIEQIARRADEFNIDVLVFTDDDVLAVEYGIPFLRGLFSYERIENDLFNQQALEAYLDEIERVAKIYPDIIMIHGVESAPFYYWNVDLKQLTWTLRQWNKHIMAINMPSPEAYLRLPVLGTDNVRIWHWTSILLLWPLAGLALAILALRRSTTSALFVGGISIVFLLENFPFKVPLMDPYQGDLGAAPYQHYIDYVNEQGGMAFWSHPEAATSIQPVELLGGLLEFVSDSPGHSEDLVNTFGYTGFAALYADTHTATNPGREWDEILMQYTGGTRDSPVWGNGDIDYHYDRKGVQLKDILSILLVKERSREAVIEALASGRMYAVRGGQEQISLRDFTVESGGMIGEAGETVTSAGRFTVHVKIEKMQGESKDVRVQLIKSGAIAAEVEGRTPLDFIHVDSIDIGEMEYVRLLVFSRGSRITSNPIFVRGHRP